MNKNGHLMNALIVNVTAKFLFILTKIVQIQVVKTQLNLMTAVFQFVQKVNF